MARFFDERLEGTGFEEAGWTKSEGTGVTIDEDFATSSVTGVPANWQDQCLKLDAKTGQPGTISKTDFTPTAKFYARVEVIVESHLLATGDNSNLFSLRSTDNPNYLWQLQLLNNAGTLQFRALVYYDDISHSFNSDAAVSLDTPYRIEVQWDEPADQWEWRIDDVTQDLGTGITSTRQFSILRWGTATAETAGDMLVYMDNLALDDTTWVGAETGGGAGRVFDETFEGAGTVETWVTGP